MDAFEKLVENYWDRVVSSSEGEVVVAEARAQHEALVAACQELVRATAVGETQFVAPPALEQAVRLARTALKP